MGALTDNALAELLNQFEDSAELLKFYTDVIARAEDSNDVMQDLISERALDVATGVWLDYIGEILGLPRPGNVQGASETFTLGSVGDDGPNINIGIGELNGFTNGYFNDATAGVTPWASGNDATLTRTFPFPITIPVFVMRVAYNGTASPYAFQTANTSGAGDLIVTGRTVGDGSSNPLVYQNGVLRWTGTTSTTEQNFDLLLDAANGGLIQFVCNGTGFCDFTWLVASGPSVFDVETESEEIGGKFNGLTGLTDGTLVDDATYRRYLQARAVAQSTTGTVVDVFNFFKTFFDEVVTIDNDVPGEVTITTTDGLIGEENELARTMSPVAAGVKQEILQ